MNSELYHHGIKGMKWGVRKSPEERYKDWKKKQHSRLDEQTAKDQAKWDKKIAKQKDRITKRGSSEVRQEQLRALKGKKEASKLLNKIGHGQIDKMGQKDYDDIVQRDATLTGLSTASIVLASMGMLPIAYFHVPSTNLNFDDYRVRHSDLESPDA